MGSLESDTTEWLHFHFSLTCIGEGNGNPLQCSCLENPRDGRAWWAAVYGVTQSRTRLKRPSSSSEAEQTDPVQLHSTQNGALWSALPGSFLEMQNSGPHYGPMESRSALRCPLEAPGDLSKAQTPRWHPDRLNCNLRLGPGHYHFKKFLISTYN